MVAVDAFSVVAGAAGDFAAVEVASSAAVAIAAVVRAAAGRVVDIVAAVAVAVAVDVAVASRRLVWHLTLPLASCLSACWQVAHDLH